MKKFIQNSVLFLLIVIVIMTINYGVNSYFLGHADQLPLKKNVVIGDSRMMTGINPDKIDDCVNYANNSESYFISYYKLKYILEHSEGIEHVIMGFSYPSFSAYMDKLFKDDFATADVLGRVYSIIPLKDYGSIPVDEEKYWTIYFRQMFVYPHKNHSSFLGEFASLPAALDTSSAKTNSIIQRHYFIDSVNAGISSINRNYLDSIQLLLEQKDIELVLVNLPMYKGYQHSIPSNFTSFFEKTKVELERKKNVHIIDFENESCPESFFKDAVHLSSEGADTFSIQLNKALKE